MIQEDALNIFETPQKTPLYLELYRKLRAKIESGEYAVGTRIPSEKEISEENGVSRITSRHALEQLVTEGYIKRFPGKGTYVQTCGPTEERVSGVPASMERSRVEEMRLIGVVMEGLSGCFGGDVLLGIEQKCAEMGYSAIIKFSYGRVEREEACIQELIAAGVRGIVMMCVYNEVYSASVIKLSLSGFPMIFMDRRLKGLAIPYVGTDHHIASMEMTDELIRRGHEHMAIVMFEESYTTSSAEERMNGFMESCLMHDLRCGNRRILLEREDAFSPNPEERGRNVALIREFLQKNPEVTALVAMSSRVAAVLLEAIAETNVRTIASFDGPRDSFKTPCELIYVVQDQLLMGSTACQELIERIDGREAPHTTYIPHRLEK